MAKEIEPITCPIIPIPEFTECDCSNIQMNKEVIVYNNGVVFIDNNYAGDITNIEGNTIEVTKNPYKIVVGYDNDGYPLIYDYTDNKNAIPPPFIKDLIVKYLTVSKNQIDSLKHGLRPKDH